MKKFLLSVYALLLGVSNYAQTDTSLILSEIMFNPQSGNNEFIEFYNTSETENIDLNNYKIKYSTSAADVIISSGAGTILPPKSFAVILEGDYDFVSGIYNNLIPPTALILKISDNAFGSSGMANTSDRTIWLINSADDTLDIHTYSANNSTAFSDEKILLTKDTTSSNWANSNSFNGTPGFRNSVTPLTFDLALTAVQFSPPVPIQGDNVDIAATVKNGGSAIADSYTLEIYSDIDFDSAGSVTELIYTQTFSSLQSGDSISAGTTLNSLPAGNYQIIAKVVFQDDEDTLNNKKLSHFTVIPPPQNFNDIVINEIMYAPASPEPEWIELYNRTSSQINLKEWKISDNSTTVSIANNDLFIQPNSFIILSKDSSILNFYSIPVEIVTLNLPALNNTGDAIVLKDSNNILIDTLSYLPEWGGSAGGRSLERINTDEGSSLSTNWGTSQSIFKATPGRKNSLTLKNYDLRINSFKPHQQFGIVGEEIELQIWVSNPGLNQSENFLIKIFRDVNSDSIPQSSEQITETSTLTLASKDSTSFEYFTSNFSQGINRFIALVETSIDEDTTNNIAFTLLMGVSVNEARGDLVINEFMYAPISPEPEWIEIFNNSGKVIDLRNYQLADNNDTVSVIENSIPLNPGEYFVFAADSSIINFYSIKSRYAVKNFPSLNNTGDEIILIDSLNRTIDSLQYFMHWGGSSGKSLERINPLGTSSDSTNWLTTKSKNKGTPGYINSVSKKDFDIELITIIFSPPYPLKGDNVSLSFKIRNNGTNPVNGTQFYIQLFDDTNLDSLPDVMISQWNGINLNASDSTIFESNYVINNLEDIKGFYALILFNVDQDTSNNYAYKNISPGFPPNSILVNEIMYTPAGGEPEWIELYNNLDDSINLKNWSVSDVVTTPVTVQINPDIFIRAKSYLVISKDSSVQNYHRIIPSTIIELDIPTLNNDADGVVLKDDRGLAIDSVKYNNIGGTNGYSLERISLNAPSLLETNWNSSKDIEMSTPGRINSVTPKFFDLAVAQMSFNPRFPVGNENVFIQARIRNNGSAHALNFTVEFYIDSDSNQTPDLHLSSLTGLNLNSGDSLELVSANPILNITQKIITAVKIIFPNDEDTLNNYVEKSVQPGYASNSILINEIMYDPSNGEPEWIELQSISNDTINLMNWSVSDLLSTPTKNFITNEDLLIFPGEYILILRDSSFFNYHPGIDAKTKIASFGTLGNTEDGIIIYDFRDGIIDSVKYKSTWGGKNGYSLERISLTATSADSSNWTTSLSKEKSTPGKENSLAGISTSLRNDLVINEIMFDPDIDNSEFIEFLNLKEDSINLGGWRIEDDKGNYFKLSDTSFIVPPNSYFILSADSLMIEKYNLGSYPNKTIAGVSSLGLTNTGELILLKDVKGNVIDSVWYSDKWHNKNFSLTKNISIEKINPNLSGNDPKNWSSSVNIVGATPSEQNSIYTLNLNMESNISVSPNPFSPDEDGFEDFTIINYKIKQPTAQTRIKIFDSKGRLVRTLTNNFPSGSSGSIIFDGKDDDGNALRIGIYIVFFEALNDNSGIVENMKTVVVVARKL